MRLALAFLSAVLLFGCAAVHRPSTPFEPVALDYIQRLRWHDWNGVARHLPEEERAPFLERMLGLEDVRITDVRLEGIEIEGDGSGAIARLGIEYYRLPSPTVKTVRTIQQWRHAEGARGSAGGWRLLTPLPPLP